MNTSINIFKIRLSTRQCFIFLILLILSGLASGCVLTGVQGSGNVVTEVKDVRGFKRVVFGGTGELFLTQYGEESLTVTADDNLMDYLEIEVRDETLFIEIDDPIGAKLRPSKPIRFNLKMKEVVGLDIVGAAKAEIGEIVTERLDLNMSGVSTVRMDSIQAHKMDLHLSGSNQVEVIGKGEVEEQKIDLSGINKYQAPGIRSKYAHITVSGTSDATVWVTDSLQVTMSGNGKLDYYGRPQVSQNGSGRVNINGLGNP